MTNMELARRVKEENILFNRLTKKKTINPTKPNKKKKAVARVLSDAHGGVSVRKYIVVPAVSMMETAERVSKLKKKNKIPAIV
mmetsp:Transcript_5895/g.8931  ORF Transcript_5895/g.8931 Transcript_5895/m.8931 type:complete len:83 (+) Transcript_5895:610-858(+)